MRNNQVLIFSTAYLPMVGGAEIAVNEITTKLSNWNFDMITAKIQPNLAKSEKLGNINIYRIGFGCNFDKFLLPILGLIKAIRLNKKNNYNLTWSIMASQASIVASLFKIFKPSKKMLLTLQEGDLESHLERYVFGNKFLYKILIRPWHLLCFKKADHIQAISHFLARRAIDNGYKKDIIVIPNGVDVEKFKINLERKNKNKQKTILTVSRLVYKNGVDDLIKAGQYLDFDFKILIAGIGKDEAKLKNLTKKLKLENKVIFLGHIDYNELPKYYSKADVFVRASLSEGLGNVFLEAMAMGVPVIATPVGGIPDFLKDRKTDLFCNVRDPKDIAEKVKEILENNNLRKDLIKNGQELIKQKYTWNKISQQMQEIFRKLI